MSVVGSAQSPSRSRMDSSVSRVSSSLQKSTPDTRAHDLLEIAHEHYNVGEYREALAACEQLYASSAHNTSNLLLMGAVHFQLRNFSESIFYSQQCIRVDPNFSAAFSNLANALKELGDIRGAMSFYVRAIKLSPRNADSYNNLAVAHMQLGQTKEAIETFKMALVLDNSLVQAHSNLGNLYKAQGRREDARRCYLEAIRLDPSFAIAWNNLAGVFKDEGQLDTAVAYYEEARRLQPEFADAHNNLGNALKEAGRLEEAMEAYQEAIRLRSDFALAHGNLASCYYDLGEMDRAIRTFKHAILLQPNYPDAHSNLGNALRETGELEQAISAYRTALRLKPDHPHAFVNLGNALKDKGMIKEAIHCYMTAARLLPRFAPAHSNLASVLKEQGKYEQALAHYQAALDADPLFSEAFSNLGLVYRELQRPEDAVKCFTTAIRIRPEAPDAYSSLGAVYMDGGRVDEAVACFRKALSLQPRHPDALANLVHSLHVISDWSSLEEDYAALREVLAVQLHRESALPCVQPFHALVYDVTLEEQRQIAQRFAERARMNVTLLELPPFRFRAKKPAERIRIGYVSSDFGNHPLAHLMASVFGLHDRDKFEIFAYALSADDGSQWRRLVEADADHCVDLSAMSNGDAARFIHNDGIHVLVNLNGYTKGARTEIFALQPAPLQVSAMGFAGTMGAPYVQYLLADGVTVPEDHAQFYTERLIRMPHSFLCNDHKQSARDVLNPDLCPSRATYGIPEDKFVFCCFNQTYKIDPATFGAWMSILKRTPNSILWLLRFPPLAEAHLIAQAKARGVRADRLLFTDVAPKDEHLRRGYLADLFLDTAACNAHTTACDILWSGTPLITLKGARMAQRVAASLLTAIGAEELVTESLEEYEELAVTLAHDMEKLWELRKGLEERRDTMPLFDTARWVRNFEQGVVQAWQTHERGEQPRDISVHDGSG